ncbi:porin [Schlegelella sp. S2-27]|uniref:Porin n=1 Tax=Caldimonas mangrovi TaxID=2944811 RepID=A0ABT0YPK8_9BURK|nr:porin [Caldimonas mangrovi]MCM5680177.1 porin [Caldimonas mangrovi]
MNGTLLRAAAALLLLPAVAQAQSTVTVYGRVDAGISKENDGTTDLAGGVNSSDALQMRQNSGSRLGFRGVEDLGGGLKAQFQIEHRFNVDTGASTSSTFWNGKSILALSGGFGTVSLGRDYTPAWYVGNEIDPFGFSTIGQMGSAAAVPGTVSRAANMVMYQTPSFNGVTSRLQYSFKETATTGARDGMGFNVEYAQGPAYAALGYERPVRAGAEGAANPTVDVWILAGGWDFGTARVTATFASGMSDPGEAAVDAGAAAESKRRHIGLGAVVKVGSGEILAMLSRLTDKTTATTDEPANRATTVKLGLGYHHHLSKRTRLYVDLGRAKTSNSEIADLSTRHGIDMGIRHNF